ncbi:MAG: hypothetical protein FH749_04120 [Firmicutes bacterium]|nr:hypothetical protein [Bacillota bacterium]
MLKRLLRWGAACLLLVLLAGWIFSHGMFIWSIDWDNPRPFLESDVNSIDYVDGKLVANLDQYRIEYIPLEDMPPHLIEAFVAVEDRRFFDHRGVDYRGIFRALRANLSLGDIAEGGSTITQQLARNLFLNLDQNLERKIAEASIALQLERRYDKEEIIEMYINQVNFGAGNWGVVRAARKYFDKDVADLTIGEAALLAGLVQAPNAYTPAKGWELAITRQRVVLNRMVDMGFITSEQAATEVYQVEN